MRYQNRYALPEVVRAAEYYMTGNSTATSIASPTAFVKITGTTSEGSLLKGGFSLSNNRATYNGPTAWFKADAIASMTCSSTNKVMALRLAKNGTTVTASESRTTSSSLAQSTHSQGFVQLSSGDYVEAWVANNSGSQNITAVDLSFTIEAIDG